MADKKSNTSVLDIRSNYCDYGNQRLDIWIMPDWCNNSIKIDGDEQTLKEIVSHLLDGNFLNYCNPIPAELKDTVANFTPNEQLIKKYGYSDWYSWCVDNWGTKWDINVNQIECSLSGENHLVCLKNVQKQDVCENFLIVSRFSHHFQIFESFRSEKIVFPIFFSPMS